MHWIDSKNKVKVKIMMPNGRWKKGYGEINISEIKVDSLVQFERFGFCRFDKYNEKTKEYEFWFTHK